MKISALSVQRPITTIMAFVGIAVLGLVSYGRLPVQLLPDFTFPTIAVVARNDMSAQEVLEEITKPVEGIASELPRVREIRAFTRSGLMWMRIGFDYGTDIQYMQVDLEERINAFRRELDDRRTFLEVFPFSTEDFQSQYMFLSVRSAPDREEELQTTTERIEQQLRSISGVANVEVDGLRRKYAEVVVNPDLLASYELDLGQVISRVQAAASEDTFLGRLMVPGETHYVRLNDRVTTIEELAEIFVDGEGIVRLRDIADVYTTPGTQSRVSRQDGKEALRVRLEREADQNLIQLARVTRDRVEEIQGSLPPGIELIIEEDFAKYVEEAISQVRLLAMIGAFLALFVPMFFFRSVRVALIVFLSVPISLVAVFNLFYAAGLSINIFSIVGLALGVGMLVDNSIVVVENSFRLFDRGLTAREAAERGGVEVGRGLLAATATTVVVFTPILFIEGELGLIAREPVLALVFPLIVSLLVALTIVPVFTWLVLRTKTKRGGLDSTMRVMTGGYRTMLKAALRNRAALLLVVAIVLTFTILESCENLRAAETSRDTGEVWVDVYFQPPSGATLSEIDRSARLIEARLSENQSVDTFGVYFDSEDGVAYMKLKERSEREEQMSEEEFRAGIIDFIGDVPGVELSLERFDQPDTDSVPLPGQQGEVDMRALDRASLEAYGARLAEAISTHPLIYEAKLEEDGGEPQYLAELDREKTKLFGVTAQQIGRTVRATRSEGTLSSIVLENGDDRTDVAFILEGVEGGTAAEVRDLPIVSPQGGTVPLGELIRLRTFDADDRIFRRDRLEGLDIEYRHDPSADQVKLAEDIEQIVASLPNPGGVSVEVGGQARRFRERNEDSNFVVWLGALLVWVVMAAVFESFWVPIAILATNPLMLIGITWALDFFNLPLDDLGQLGIVLLVGLAVNNGIVMLDRALTLQREGNTRTRAVYTAALTRLRPIIMTYFTTVLGLLPMALIGEEDDQWRSVSVVVIGGLTSATFLTLLVLPCFYLIGDDFVKWSWPTLRLTGTVLFELVDAAVNIVLHPVRVYRREITLAPHLGPLLRQFGGFLWQSLRVPLILLRGLPGDVYTVLMALLAGDRRGRPVRETWRTRALRRVTGWLSWLLRVLVLIPGRWALRAAWWLLLTAWWLAMTPIRLYRRWRGLGPILRPARDAAPVSPVVIPTAPAVRLRNIQVYFDSVAAGRPLAALPAPVRDRLPLPADGRVHALRGISLDLDRGLFGLLGPNGAGKTTLLRTLAGLHDPTRGSVRLFGVSHREAAGALAPLIGYLPQTHGHDRDLTLYDFLNGYATLTARALVRARALGSAHPQIAERIHRLKPLETPGQRRRAILDAIEAVNLSEVAFRRLATFSGGMRQRAGIARILLQSPPILLVDEPTAGLDPVERIRIRQLLAGLARERLVVFSTHIVEDLDEQTCGRLAILDRGALVYDGPPSELRAPLEGQLWDVFPEEPESPLEGFAHVLQRSGVRILVRILRDGRQGFRVISPTPPASASRAVSPTLEDALLARLGGERLVHSV